jgi:hypothetical protein
VCQQPQQSPLTQTNVLEAGIHRPVRDAGHPRAGEGRGNPRAESPRFSKVVLPQDCLNRTGFVGGSIPREDGPYGTTGGWRARDPDGPGAWAGASVAVGGDPVRVKDPLVARALRRLRRAWAASENGRSVDTGWDQRGRGRECCLLSAAMRLMIIPLRGQVNRLLNSIRKGMDFVESRTPDRLHIPHRGRS